MIICRNSNLTINETTDDGNGNITQNDISNLFTCQDYKVSTDGNLILDVSQDISQIVTQESIIQTTVDNKTIGSYSVSFYKPLQSNDTDNDTILARSVQDVYWIYGPIENFNDIYNLNDTNFSGAASIDLTDTTVVQPGDSGNGGLGQGDISPGNNEDNTSSNAVQIISQYMGAVIVLTFMLLQ